MIFIWWVWAGFLAILPIGYLIGRLYDFLKLKKNYDSQTY